MKFKSKKDLWLGLVLWISMIGGLIATIIDGSGIAIFIMALSFILVAVIWFGMGYYIENDILEIKVGPFSSKINIEEIKSIEDSRNPLSSPALSLDRIKIVYGYSRVALISPKEKDLFIEELLKINSDINIK